MTPLEIAHDEAVAELELARPHIEKALAILAKATGVDPKSAFSEFDVPKEQFLPLRVMRNAKSAELYVSDYHGS